MGRIVLFIAICFCILEKRIILTTTPTLGSFAEFNMRLFSKGDLLDFGDDVFPDDSGRGFGFKKSSRVFRKEPTKIFEQRKLPTEFSITSVFTPKTDRAFLFAIVAPDSQTIRMGLSINKTQPTGVSAKAVHEIFFWYNDDLSKFGYKAPVARAVVPEFLDKPDSVQWRMAVHVTEERVAIYWDCNRDTPEVEAPLVRKSLEGNKEFFEKGASMFVLSGGPAYEKKFEGNVLELRIYTGKTGVAQRCTNFNSWPDDDSDDGSGLAPNRAFGNVFKRTTTKTTTSTAAPTTTTTTAPTTEQTTVASTTAAPTTITTTAPTSEQTTVASSGPVTTPRKPVPTRKEIVKSELQNEAAAQTQQLKRKCPPGVVEDGNVEDGFRKGCRLNFLQTSAKPTTTTPMPTTTTPMPTTTTAMIPKKCTCTAVKGERGDRGPPGSPGVCKSPPGNKLPEKQGLGDWEVLDTTVAPRPAVGVKGAKGEPGTMGKDGRPGPRGPPGKDCQAGPGGKVVVKGGKVKVIEAGSEWELLDTTTPMPKPTPAPRARPGPKGDKGDRGPPGQRCMPNSGARVKVEGGKVKIVEGEREWGVLTTRMPTIIAQRPGMKGAKGDKGESGLRGWPGKAGVCRKCDINNAPASKGMKGEPGVCLRKCPPGDPGREGRPGPQGRKGEPGTQGRFDPRDLEENIRKVLFKPELRNMFRGEKGTPGRQGRAGSCSGGGSNGKTCPLGTPSCTNDCNRGPPGPRGPAGVGLDRLGSFGYGALTFRTMGDLYDVSEYFPAGSIVYVEQTEDGRPRMYIKTTVAPENDWREIISQFGAPLRIPSRQTTTTAPLRKNPKAITERKKITSRRKLYLIALDKQLRGNMGDLSGNGHAKAEHMCETSARRSGLEGDFGAVLGHEYLELANLVHLNERDSVPIVNSKSEILFNSWSDFLAGARLNSVAPLLTFSGRDILRDSLWSNKVVWLGSDQTGRTKFRKTATCRMWTRANTKKLGLAADLAQGQLLNTRPISCSQNAFVLCVQTSTSPMVLRRKKK